MAFVKRYEDCQVCGLKNGRFISFQTDLPGVSSYCDYCSYQGTDALAVRDGKLLRCGEDPCDCELHRLWKFEK